MTSRQQPAPEQHIDHNQPCGLHVFAYGSLMYRDIFEAVTQSSPDCTQAILLGWKRFSLNNREYPGAMPAHEGESSIQGVLWLNVDANALCALDQFEGTEYQRVRVKVSDNNGLHYDALVYQWLDPSALFGPWSRQDFERKHRKHFVKRHWYRHGSRP